VSDIDNSKVNAGIRKMVAELEKGGIPAEWRGRELQLEVHTLRAKLEATELKNEKLIICNSAYQRLNEELQIGRNEARRQVELQMKIIVDQHVESEYMSKLVKENNELQAQVAMLRGALEGVLKQRVACTESCLDCSIAFCDSYRVAEEALSTTPTEAAERVQGLVDALELLIGLCEQAGDFKNGNVYSGMDEGETLAYRMVDGAKETLTKYRGEVGE
jgi:hypothetical protein